MYFNKNSQWHQSKIRIRQRTDLPALQTRQFVGRSVKRLREVALCQALLRIV